MIAPERQGEGDAWHAAAEQLGLRVFLTCAPFSEEDSFRQMMSRLAMEATRPRSVTHMMAGAVEEARVLVATYATPKKIGAPTSDTAGKHFSYWTAVAMELDPPLEIGLWAEQARTFSTFVLGEDFQVGVPVLDKALRIKALDGNRLRELFWPRDPSDQLLAENLAVAAGRGLFLSDSMVGYKLDGNVTDAMTLRGSLLDLLNIRRALALRAHRLGTTPYGEDLRRKWAQFADSAGLAFDPHRLALSGVVRGVPLEVAQEAAPGRFQVAVRCRFPQPIEAQVRLTKVRRGEGEPDFDPPPFLLAMVGVEDVVVGDTAFDRAFQIQGYPVEPVKAAFQNAGFRTQLMAVARVASHLELTHDGASWFIPRPPQSAAELQDHVEMAVRVARSREPEEAAPGPYR